MNNKYALVGCGAAKRSEPSEARHLYTSTYFKKKRQVAEQFSQWWILSAEHGAIRPSVKIDPYETHIDDVDTDQWARNVRRTLRTNDSKWIASDSELLVLAGQKYIEPIREVLTDLENNQTFEVTVRYPFSDTSGIGEQLSVLDDMASDHSTPSTEPQTQSVQKELTPNNYSN